MSAFSTMSSKGQITVPIEIRQRLGLKQGTRVEFLVDNGQTIVRPARPAGNPFEKYRGCLPAFKSMGEINDWVDSLRSADDRK